MSLVVHGIWALAALASSGATWHFAGKRGRARGAQEAAQGLASEDKSGIGLVPTEALAMSQLPPGTYITLGKLRDESHFVAVLECPDGHLRTYRMSEPPHEGFGVNGLGEVMRMYGQIRPASERRPTETAGEGGEVRKPRTPRREVRDSVRIADPVPPAGPVVIDDADSPTARHLAASR